MYLETAQYDKAVQCFEVVLDADNLGSHIYYQIAEYYYYGKNADKPYYEKAMRYFQCAAEKNNTDAMSMLGDMYFHGAINQDLNLAQQWYEKAARLGNAKSQYILGYFLEYGICGVVDYEAAKYWYEKAAAQGRLKDQEDMNQYNKSQDY